MKCISENRFTMAYALPLIIWRTLISGSLICGRWHLDVKYFDFIGDRMRCIFSDSTIASCMTAYLAKSVNLMHKLLTYGKNSFLALRHHKVTGFETWSYVVDLFI